jgi:hypothetical protein
LLDLAAEAAVVFLAFESILILVWRRVVIIIPY